MSRRRYQRRSSSNGMGLVCLVAGLALVAVMGVTILGESKTKPPRAKKVVVAVPEPVAPIATPAPEPAPVKLGPILTWKRQLRAAEKQLPALKQKMRGPGFEEARVELLSEINDVRDEIGALLDEQPSHDAANRLWDRTLKLLAALRKL